MSNACWNYLQQKDARYECAQFTFEEKLRGYEREFNETSLSRPGAVMKKFHLSLLLGDMYTQKAQSETGPTQKELYAQSGHWYQQGQIILQQVRSSRLELSLEESTEHSTSDSGSVEPASAVPH